MTPSRDEGSHAPLTDAEVGERLYRAESALREIEFLLAPSNKGEFWYDALLAARNALQKEDAA